MNVPLDTESRSATIGEPTRARLRSDVNLAGSILSRSWPLENFIAVNPLSAFEHMDFRNAVKKAGEVLGARGTLHESSFRALRDEGRIRDSELLRVLRVRYPELSGQPPLMLGGVRFTVGELILQDLLTGDPAPDPQRTNRMISEIVAPEVAALVDAQTSKWCSAFLDESQSAWSMPQRELGFYDAWRDLAPRDHTIPAASRRSLRALPETPEAALFAALKRLGIGPEGQRSFFQAHLTRMPGWAAHIRWREERREGLNLVAYLAMRTSYESLLLEHVAPRNPAREETAEAVGSGIAASSDDRAAGVARTLGVIDRTTHAELADVSRLLESLPVEDRGFIWLEAYEGAYRDRLLAQLSGPRTSPVNAVSAQLVCCIDVRSEGLRRNLEHVGAYETFGFAGFFAVAIRYQDLAGGQPTSLCPVLLEPRNHVTEHAAPGTESEARKHVDGLNTIAAAESSFHSAESHPASPFILAETTGWAKGPLAAAKTLFSSPYSNLRARLKDRTAPPAPTVVDVENGFTIEERTLFAEVTLAMMGLTDGFARLVVLCGHGSTTENNPYESALDCGACGGNRGAPNARTAAAILNGSGLRKELAKRGISIPGDTWFVAAEHDTATDQVTVLDTHLVPASHEDDLRTLNADLDEACARLSAERCESLPGSPAKSTPSRATRHARGRSTDWAQVFPEWGLAGNAAFIIGPRSITRGIDLGRRTFLHSYEATDDPNGEALETILTAPLIVAQWINCQYYFSTVDPVVFGAGTKATHNVVGGFGVMAGYGGDLLTGLPWQSVADGDRLVHEPMRLLTVVQAPLALIESIIERNPLLQDLFGNRWLALAGRESENESWMQYQDGGWLPWIKPEEK